MLRTSPRSAVPIVSRSGEFGSLLRDSRLFRIPLLEAVDAAGRVDELLLAGEEGVATRAYVDPELFLRRAGLPRRTARAVNVDLLVLRMNLWFHEVTSSRVYPW